MKERPILFSAPMVRAILEGRKTQTRRVVDVKKFSGPNETHNSRGKFKLTQEGLWTSSAGVWNVWSKPHACPFGQPGDRLWVRETWMVCDVAELEAQVLYKASNDVRPNGISIEEFGSAKWFNRPSDEVEKFKESIQKMEVQGDVWRPSIFMPRWASRIILEVVSVRVERLNDISEADAIAEGCLGGNGSIPNYSFSATPREHFRHIWKNHQCEQSYNDNPWVWVVEFKKISL